MSNALRVLCLLGATVPASAFALTWRDRDVTPIDDYGDVDVDTGVIVLDDTGGYDDPSGGHTSDPNCRSQCQQAYASCQIGVFTTYQQCRANAFEHANWLIRYAGIIDVTMLDDMLAACEFQGNAAVESCAAVQEACTASCE
jgi:hypothetical protein